MNLGAGFRRIKKLQIRSHFPVVCLRANCSLNNLVAKVKFGPWQKVFFSLDLTLLSLGFTSLLVEKLSGLR